MKAHAQMEGAKQIVILGFRLFLMYLQIGKYECKRVRVLGIHLYKYKMLFGPSTKKNERKKKTHKSF